LSQLSGLGSLLLYALDLALFLLPGFAVALIVSARRKWCGERALMMTIVGSAALGYVAFWAYFGSRTLGRAFSYVVLAAAVAITAAILRQPSARAVARSIAVPVGYVAAVGACYTCLLFLYQDPWSSGAEVANVRFFSSEAPGDNRIPLIFAERIYAHQPVEPFCCGDWRSSDRPPLQAGIFLLQRPFKLFGNVRLNYQLLGTGLQCLWICGVWILLKSLGAFSQEIRMVLGFLVFWAFLFYNSVYVWPKLMAAALVLFTIGTLIEAWRKARQVTWFETGLAASSFGLAMLAHPGCVFTTPALIMIALRNRRFWTAQKLITGTALIAVMFAPWIAYQKFYDPPGNRLVKMHLAGVSEVDSRSTWQAIKDAYSSKSLATIARDKWDNVKTLMGPHPFTVTRRIQERYVFSTLGVLNCGWLVLPFVAFRTVRTKAASVLIGMAALNVLVWCVVLIGPGYAITATSSYADLLLLSIGLTLLLRSLPRPLRIGLFVLQMVNLFFVWVCVRPASELRLPLLIIGLAIGAALAWHFGKAIWQPQPASPDALPECPLRY
jgi:hypothetical protein